MKNANLLCVLLLTFLILSSAANSETLPPLNGAHAPDDFTTMWAGFDPRAEPLETEILKEWEEEGVVLRIVRFRIGVFKGKEALLAAIYGFPQSAIKAKRKLPGLVQIHGGGQYADYKACLANAKRGYATVSIAWAGRINAPGYRVSPAEVKLFWDGKTDDPNYRLTTDWGLLDGYHAPGRNRGNVFPSAKAAAWTLDAVESPRNSGWFLCALAARRTLTFLEQQAEVDGNRLGVYGHSMGGKLTVMAATDPRVKAAAPSCGGISDRDNASPLFRQTLGDDVSLKQVSCPILFLSPANDFHGRIGDLPSAVAEIQSDQWRVTCSPHHNHQDTPPYEVATMLWFDQHLKQTFEFPTTPETKLRLENENGVPTMTVATDPGRQVKFVDVFYTQQGRADERPEHREATMHRFWHHVRPEKVNEKKVNESWTAELPVSSLDKPLWVYANVVYQLEQPVSGVGYYYGSYTAETCNVSSLLKKVSPEDLKTANVKPSLQTSLLIEDFQGDWKKEWFSYRPAEWSLTTHKLNSPIWKAPSTEARLSLEVQSVEPNLLVILMDGCAAEIKIPGGNRWHPVSLSPADFRNFHQEPLSDWNSVRRLKLSPAEHLRASRGDRTNRRRVGKAWQGTPPSFRRLRWEPGSSRQ